MFKKSLSLIFSLLIAVCFLTACGSDSSGEQTGNADINPVLTENISTEMDLLEIKAADGNTLATLNEQEPIDRFVNSLDLSSWTDLDTPDADMRPSYTYVLSTGNSSVTLTAYIAHNCVALTLPQETLYFNVPEAVSTYLNSPEI